MVRQKDCKKSTASRARYSTDTSGATRLILALDGFTWSRLFCAQVRKSAPAMDTPTTAEIQSAVSAILAFREDIARLEEAIEQKIAILAKHVPAQAESDFGVPFYFRGSCRHHVVEITRPVAESYDQSVLENALVELSEKGFDYSSFAVSEWKVDRRKLKKQPPEVQAIVNRALIRTPYKEDGTLRALRVRILEADKIAELERQGVLPL